MDVNKNVKIFSFKLEFPHFNKSKDLTSWIFQTEQLFEFQHTPVEG